MANTNITMNEPVLFEDLNSKIKLSQDEKEMQIGVIVTSKAFKIYANNKDEISSDSDMNVNKITIPVYYTIKFSEITFHALNKEKGYVMLQLDLANEIILNQDFIIRKHEYLFIYPKEKLDVINFFDQISVGSSLNPDTQEEDPKIEYGRLDQFNIQNGMSKINYYEQYEDEDEYEYGDEEQEIEKEETNIEQQDICNTNNQRIDLDIDENYQPYNYTNTIDKIFKTEKKKRDLSENDPRRYEDA